MISICCRPNCTVCGIDPKLEWNEYSRKWQQREHKMTREEAKEKIAGITTVARDEWLDVLEKLGLLKFDEPKKDIKRIFSVNQPGKGWDGPNDSMVNLSVLVQTFGVIRLEQWPEGLVLWVGGEIVWNSWEKTAKVGDYVDIDWYDYPSTNKVYTGQIRKIK